MKSEEQQRNFQLISVTNESWNYHGTDKNLHAKFTKWPRGNYYFFNCIIPVA